MRLNPKGDFFVLLIVASMIASFGLVANSTAVIIGAMLVSPLMTPIFGIALAMLRGYPRLLFTALCSEIIGIALAVGSAYLVGLPQLSFVEATPEMLSRTQPNLLDLLVAVLAGFAGAYALVDERVSPALPGVAIATAIVPPLSTCGLCLSLGAWEAAGGAMLLFLANFVAILVVGLITFWASGLVRQRPVKRRHLLAQFGPTFIAFVVISVILTKSLLTIQIARTVETGIRETLDEQLAFSPTTVLEEFVHNWDSSGVQVLATVRSHRTISPRLVSAMQAAIAETLSLPVDLVVRTVRSRDVSPEGSTMQVVRPNLKGKFLVPSPLSFDAKEALASQVLREAFEEEPGVELTRVEFGRAKTKQGIVVAYLNTLRRLTQGEIDDIEEALQARLGESDLVFLARVNSSAIQDRNGPVRVEWNNILAAGPNEASRVPALRKFIEQSVETSLGVKALGTHFNWRDDRWRVLVEVMGPAEIGRKELATAQAALPAEINVELIIWKKRDYVVTQTGLTTYNELTDPYLQDQAIRLRELFRSEQFESPPARESPESVGE